MKYIISQINLIDNHLAIEPIYAAKASYGEPLYLRITTGNFDPDSIEVIFESSSMGTVKTLSKKQYGVFETYISETMLPNFSKSETITFSMYLKVKMNDEVFLGSIDNIVKILGRDLEDGDLTDLDRIYTELSKLEGKIYG